MSIKSSYLSYRLLNWIQSKVPDIPITNFTTDWNDGKAVGALVDAVAPGKYIKSTVSFMNQIRILTYRIANNCRLLSSRLMSGLARLEIE